MQTIKFQSWDGAYPLFKGTDREQHAKSTSVVEAEKIWHRPFQLASLKEYEAWRKKFGWGARHTTCQIVGEDPGEAFRTRNKNAEGVSIYFEYLTFYDREGEFNKVIIFCANAYVMNAEGQTIDSISV